MSLIAACAVACASPPSDLFHNRALEFWAADKVVLSEHPNSLAVLQGAGFRSPLLLAPGLVGSELSVLRWTDEGLVELPRIELEHGALQILTANLDGDPGDEVVISHFRRDVRIYEVDFDASAQVLRLIEKQRLDLEVPEYVATGDLNGDGRVDLAVTRLADRDLTPFFATPAFEFVRQEATTLPAGPTAVLVGDVNGDQENEVVVAASLANELVVLDASEAPPWPIADRVDVPGWPADLALSHDDGKIRIIGTSNLGDSLFVARFSPSLELSVEILPANPGAFGVELADMDGDGSADAVVADKFHGTISIFRGPDFELRQTIAVGDGPTPVCALDLSGDGVLDLVTANGFSNDLSVLIAAPQTADP